jgi:hypothetical protein
MTPRLISRSSDLVTLPQEICRGFLSQAQSKTQKATPYVREAKELWVVLQQISHPNQLFDKIPLRTLATAMGFSDKAQSYFSDGELREAINPVLDLIAKDSGADFRTEILYRFLLTRGDTLGGEMRNLTGESGPTKFIAAVVKALKERNITPTYIQSKTDKIKGIIWDERLLFFDYKPKLIGKNVDVILLQNPCIQDIRPEFLEDKTLYLACGELKGGIDPAGADEHWKTAGSALERIRSCFGQRYPKLFFAASAIENAMAEEIYQQLRTGKLTHAANLTVEAQVQDLANWLISL